MEKNKLKSIHYGNSKDLPKEIRDKYNLKYSDMYVAKGGEEAHIIEGLKNNLDDAGHTVIGKLWVKRNNNIYEHQSKDKIFYIEDIENIINIKVKEAQKEILKDFNKCVDSDDYRDAEKKWNQKLF